MAGNGDCVGVYGTPPTEINADPSALAAALRRAEKDVRRPTVEELTREILMVAESRKARV